MWFLSLKSKQKPPLKKKNSTIVGLCSPLITKQKVIMGKMILLIFLTLAVVTQTGIAEKTDFRIMLYKLCQNTVKPTEIDLNRFVRQEITFSTRDPNFFSLGTADYSGVPLYTLLSESPCHSGTKDSDFIIIAKDQYVLHDTLKKSGGILTYKLNSKPIPSKYGGPLKILYETFPSQEASIWYVSSIVVGSLKTVKLKIETGPKTIYFDIEHLKSMESKTETAPILLPRGYRIDHFNSKSINVMYLPFASVLAAVQADHLHFKIQTYSGLAFEFNDPGLVKYLYLVFQFNGADIPIQWGGPFILAFKDNQNHFVGDRQPYYFIHTISIE